MANEPAEIWFLTGSESLYGEEVLEQVATQSREVCQRLAGGPGVHPRLVWKPVLTTADAIRRTCLDATADDRVVGVVAWMHTALADFADMSGVELLMIDAATDYRSFVNHLRWNSGYHRLAQRL
ncbi:hypothetical protein [Plantactinospora sp. KLBMP9567]|uniref:hypothetical protein n=1 Tax=Plantactinospora sp. KLBMP9567 TaxID=3085900 RepID=UPI00298114B7|nr:hypothetical protein [Plantactinospora sp. KLBMP9567]MDW5326691.1 hypothetical protein [Plantactinospora sp. KLBMP9567]